jgi:hypothetical protein
MFDAYFWPDDVDAMHLELTARGAKIIQPPTDQPYGLREFRVQDPDGHILAFAPCRDRERTERRELNASPDRVVVRVYPRA